MLLQRSTLGRTHRGSSASRSRSSNRWARAACAAAPAARASTATTLAPATSERDVLRGRFVIDSAEASGLLAGCPDGPALHAFLMSLVQPASKLARAPISSFRVGAVGLGMSGAIYVGVNVEFPGLHLNNSIHAEQFLLLNCLRHGERGLRVLAVSEAPCGHCRQFLAETSTADHTRIVFGATELHPHAHAPLIQPARARSRPKRKRTSLSLSPGPSAPPPTATTTASASSSASADGRVAAPSARAPSPLPPATPAHSAFTLNDLLPRKFGPLDLITEGDAFPLLLEPQAHAVAVPGRSLAALEARRRGSLEAGSSSGGGGSGSSSSSGRAAGGGSGSSGANGNGNGRRAAAGGVGPELLARGVREAERWAQQCYAPYTRCPSGVAILTASGCVYGGGYVESAAYNPSLTPFHAAWAAAVADHVTEDQVQEVVLVELPRAAVKQRPGVRELVRQAAPHARFTPLALAATKG